MSGRCSNYLKIHVGHLHLLWLVTCVVLFVMNPVSADNLVPNVVTLLMAQIKPTIVINSKQTDDQTK